MASETMTNPRILFCDEPTSGLDSFMAFSVVDILKKLALQGKTVICTIHQPSSQIVEMFDKVLLLAEGRTAFLGHVSSANKFLESCGFPCPPQYNPADHWLTVRKTAMRSDHVELMFADPGCGSRQGDRGEGED